MPYDSPVQRFVFGSCDLIEIEGVQYTPRSSDRFGHVLARVEGDLCESFRHDQIQNLMSAGKLLHFPGRFAEQQAASRNRHGEQRVSDLRSHEQQEIDRRVFFCVSYARMEATERWVSRSEGPMQRAIDHIQMDYTALLRARIGEKKRSGKTIEIPDAPSPTLLRKWLRLYADSGLDPMSLRSGVHRSGNRIPRVDIEVIEFAQRFVHAYQSREKPTMALVYRSYLAAVDEENAKRAETGGVSLRKLSRTAFENRVRGIGVFAKDVGRRGMKAALLDATLSMEGQKVVRPLQLVEMDEWKVTLQTLLTRAGLWRRLTKKQKEAVQRSRTWLTVAMDTATRCILGMRLLVEPPSADSAVSTLEMAIFPKEHYGRTAGSETAYIMCGLMEEVVTDSGAGLISGRFRAAIHSLGGTKLTPPAGMAPLRGRVERIFGTIHTQLMGHFSGQTFENIFAKGDYDSEANACLDVEELNRTLIRYVVDIYHNTPHSGLAGATPYEEWLRLSAEYGVAPPPSEDIRRHVFGLELHRRIRSIGIKVLGLEYQSRALQQLGLGTGQLPIRIRVNRHDLGAISVWTGEGWLTVPCKFALASGVSYWEWVDAAESLHKKNAEMAALSEGAVHRAINDIRKLADTARKRCEIGEPILTADMLNRAERKLFKTFDFAERPVDGDDDLLLADDDDLEQPAAPVALLPPPDAIPPKPANPADDDEFGDEDDWLTEG